LHLTYDIICDIINDMTQRIIKDIKKILQSQKNVSLETLNKILIFFDYTCRQPRSGSSHYTFSKSGCKHIITIPFNRPLKEIYVKTVIKLLDLEVWYEKNK